MRSIARWIIFLYCVPSITAFFLFDWSSCGGNTCQHGVCKKNMCICETNWGEIDCSSWIDSDPIPLKSIQKVHDNITHHGIFLQKDPKKLQKSFVIVQIPHKLQQALFQKRQVPVAEPTTEPMIIDETTEPADATPAPALVLPAPSKDIAKLTVPAPLLHSRCGCVHGKCNDKFKCECEPEYTGSLCDTPRCEMDCSLHGICLAHTCVCNAGYYGKNCQHKRCPRDCSTHGYCLQGVCQCSLGYKGPGCEFYEHAGDTLTIKLEPTEVQGRGPTLEDALSLRAMAPKSCPGNCSNRGDCNDGHCMCWSGYSGEMCQHSCPNECSHQGECIEGACLCFAGYLGVDCSEKGCCSGHGSCQNPGECECGTGWAGDNCSIMVMCPDPACGGHGTCEMDGKCHCNRGWGGPTCMIITPACEPACVNGTCNAASQSCMCRGRWEGAACDKQKHYCKNDCNNQGLCAYGTCLCAHGFGGDDCSKIVPLVGGVPAPPPALTITGGGKIQQKNINDEDFGTLTAEESSPQDYTLRIQPEFICPHHCNQRGTCIHGKCQCEKGFWGPGCERKRCPSGFIHNRPQIHRDCSGHGLCNEIDGTCTCANGWDGVACIQKICTQQCINGSCGNNGKCQCRNGWTGETCFEQQKHMEKTTSNLHSVSSKHVAHIQKHAVIIQKHSKKRHHHEIHVQTIPQPIHRIRVVHHKIRESPKPSTPIPIDPDQDEVQITIN